VAKTHFARTGGQKWVDSFYRPNEPLGNVFYVHSSGTSTGPGYSPETAYSTISAAITAATASQGDTVIVLPGHAETVTAASGVDFSKAGITVIGLGVGTNKPTITLGTATTASVDFSAANSVFRNFRLVSNINDLATFVEGGAGNVLIEDCDFVTSNAKEALAFVTVPTTYDDWTIRRCRFIQPTDPAGSNAAAGTGAVYLVDSENVLIEDCEFRGCFETAFVHNKTTAAANLWVRRCYGVGSTSTADSVPFVLVSTATGGAERCSFINPNEAATTEATLSGTFGAGFFNFESYFGNDGGGGQLAIVSQSAAS